MPKAPLRIGIIGAPKSGKSKLARDLKKVAPEILGHEPVVVDNYAQKLQRDTKLALGQFATYSENYMIAGARHAAERKAIETGASVITVGTMVETFLYGVVTTDAEMQAHDPVLAMKIAQGAMAGLGVILSETVDYDALIYLPYTKTKGDNWAKLFDEQIPNISFNFSLPIITVEGTQSERIQKASNILKSAHAASPELEVPVDQAVDESGEASE